MTLCAKGPCRCQLMAARQASQPRCRLKMLSVSKCYIHDLALVLPFIGEYSEGGSDRSAGRPRRGRADGRDASSAEGKGKEGLLKLEEAIKEPYSDKFDVYFETRPEWASQKAGCSMLSCSS